MDLEKEKLLLIIPVYNEEKILEKNIKKLDSFLSKYFNSYLIVISDNLSNDKTPIIAKNLEKELENVCYLRINKKGKGIAIKHAVSKFYDQFSYFMFIDADLPIKLEKILDFYKKLKDCDLVLGNRRFIYIPLVRKVTSYGYKLLANLVLFCSFSKIKDFQAGIMAWNKKVAKILVNEVKDDHWFFSTELIYLALKSKMKVCFVDVNYKIEKRTSVKVFRDSLYFLKKLVEFRIKTLLKIRLNN